MSYPENKAERYSLIGGLNTKVSRYDSGQQELIRLVNYDHSVPGSITKRPDTAQFLGTSFGTDLQGIFEQTYLSGASYRFIYGLTGAFYTGNTTSQAYYGFSTASFGAAAFLGGVANNRPDSINTSDTYWVGALGVSNGLLQSHFLKFHATLSYFANAQMQIVTSPLNFGATFASYAGAFFASGSAYRYTMSFVNERGIVGPAMPLWMRAVVQSQGATSILLRVPAIQTAGFGTKLYNNAAYGTMLMFRETAIGNTAAQRNLEDVSVTTAIFAIPVTPGVTQIIDDGSATATYLMDPLAVGGLAINDYYRFDATNSSAPKMIPPANIVSATFGIKNTGEPKYLAVLNNMMLFAGFSMAPSHVFWSQLGTPEWVANDDFNEVRTDNGDLVSGMIPYGNTVVVGKKTSIHEVTGTSPDTISFQQTTAQYGFLNNQSMAIWRNQLWFLDGQGKGICEYNGANTDVVSTKVEDIFKRINLTAAINTAWMLHVKQRNEVWAAIPVDGATIANTLVVYDYEAQAWSTFEGLAPNVAAICKGTQVLPVPVFGFSNGDIRFMNATYSGAEFMTTAVRFPFTTNFGWSTTQVFRRLFVDVDPVVGMTHLFNTNFYLNDSNTVALTRGITTIGTQTRIDFGLPGNGMSVELIEGSTLPCRVMGYTVESRFQRNV